MTQQEKNEIALLINQFLTVDYKLVNLDKYKADQKKVTELAIKYGCSQICSCKGNRKVFENNLLCLKEQLQKKYN